MPAVMCWLMTAVDCRFVGRAGLVDQPGDDRRHDAQPAQQQAKLTVANPALPVADQAERDEERAHDAQGDGKVDKAWVNRSQSS